MRLTLIAVGRAKRSPEQELFNSYLKRLKPKLDLIEVEVSGDGAVRLQHLPDLQCAWMPLCPSGPARPPPPPGSAAKRHRRVRGPL